ncbi:MAG TPA: GAF domain-containing protein, partial [Candidatus Limnocylindrales bacterium]
MSRRAGTFDEPASDRVAEAHGSDLSRVRPTRRRGLTEAIRAGGRLLASDTVDPASLPISPRLAAAFAVLGYVLIVVASGASDHPRSDLVALPLVLAAALLPALHALVVGAVVVTIALGPVLANWGTTDGASVHVVSVGVIVAASLALRAAMAGLTIARAGQLDEARRTAERMDSVLDIAQRLTRTFDRKAIFETIVTELRRALAVDVATIRVLVGDQLPVAAWAGIPDDLARRLPVYRRDSEWFTEISRSARPLVSDDAAADVERAADYRTESAAIELASILSVPLFDSGAVIGALSVATVAPRHWTAGDVELVSAIATHASIAIRNAELFERTETRAAQLGVLQAASARMSRQNTIDSVGRAIVEETRRILDYHNARVYVLEPPDDLVPIAFEGRVGAYEKVDLELLRTKVGQGFTGWAAAHDEALLIGDANADPRGSTIPGTDDVDESMLVVPMTYDGEVVGVITLSKLGLDQFDEDDVRLLEVLAGHAAVAVENARLYESARREAESATTLLEFGRALATASSLDEIYDRIVRLTAQLVGSPRT